MSRIRAWGGRFIVPIPEVRVFDLGEGRRVPSERGQQLMIRNQHMKFAWNIVSTLSANLVMLVLALLSSIVLARTLGPEDRGLFALVLLIPEFATSFGLLGFEQANTIYAGLDPSARKPLVWHSAVLAIVGGTVLALGAAAFLKFGTYARVEHGPMWLYLVPLTVIPGKIVLAYWRGILRGANHIFLLNALDVGSRATLTVVILALVGGFKLGVGGAVVADFLLAVGQVAVAAALLHRIGAWGKPSFDRSLWSRSWRFALPSHYGTLASYLNYRTDQFIVAALLPPQQLAFYVLAVGLAEPIWTLVGSVTTPLLPHLTNSPGRNPALAAIVSRHVLIWTGLACGLMFTFGGLAVRILYSPSFEPAVAPLRWLLPGIFTLSLGKILVAELLARERRNFQFLFGSAVVALNVAANFLLIPRMGISGAALASTISYSFLSLLVAWYYLRDIGVSWRVLVPRPSDISIYRTLWVRRSDHATVVTGDIAGDAI